jgi:hypothetical protein
MSLDTKVEPHHALTYANNVMMVQQQLKNPFRAAVTEVMCKGEAHAAADMIGALEYLTSAGRDRTNIENVAQNDRRWLVFPDEIKSGQYLDREDKFQLIYDPTGPVVRNHTVAVTRGIADRILGISRNSAGTFVVSHSGVMGSVNSGKRPGTVAALPAGNTIPVNAEGLTLAKLIETKEALALDDFGIEDDDQLYCAITPRQVTDLLNIAAATDTALNAFELQQLRTGQPTTLMGMTWIVTNRLPKTSTTRHCPVWSKRNIVLGVWQDITGKLVEDTHADAGIPYVSVRARVDCVRVRIIDCLES